MTAFPGIINRARARCPRMMSAQAARARELLVCIIYAGSHAHIMTHVREQSVCVRAIIVLCINRETIIVEQLGRTAVIVAAAPHRVRPSIHIHPSVLLSYAKCCTHTQIAHRCALYTILVVCKVETIFFSRASCASSSSASIDLRRGRVCVESKFVWVIDFYGNALRLSARRKTARVMPRPDCVDVWPSQ